MKKAIGVILIGLFFLLNSCSWQEYFLIFNETEFHVLVEYEIEKTDIGFPIFMARPSLYKIAKNGGVSWEEKITAKDEDSLVHLIKIVLPPHSVLNFGLLSNDRYQNYDQKFINDRVFNLDKIVIEVKGEITEILPEKFDVFFIKGSNGIAHRIK